MAPDRVELSRPTVIIAVLGVFTAGALGSWTVGKTADGTGPPLAPTTAATAGSPQFLTDDGPLGVNVRSNASMKLILPEDKRDDLHWRPFGEEGSRQAARALGSIDVGSGIVFDLFGNADTPLVVKAIDAVNVECEYAEGRWFGVAELHGSYMPQQFLGIQLKDDADEATGFPLEGEGQPENEDDWEFPQPISGIEGKAFLALVSAPPTSVCTYRLRITYRHEGKDSERSFDDDGAPFKVAGEALVADYDY